jgi:beta-glucosidase
MPITSQPILTAAPTLATASAPASALDLPFILATGIECSAPRIADGGRHDQLLATGHWDRVAEDAALVRRLGLRSLRYGIPFHVVARDPGRHDWAWTDAALDMLAEAGIEPVADLLHFGVPDDLTGVTDRRLVGRFVDYVEAFVARYPWIRWYTPVNEPSITALFSAKRGWWNERATDDAAFAQAIDVLVECAIRGAEVIQGSRADALILQSDACDAYRPASLDVAPLAAFLDEQRYAAFDLTLGRRPIDAIAAWLATGGVDDRRLAWFGDHAIRDGFIVGLDHYFGNERLVGAGGAVSTDPDPRGFAALARGYHERYGRPMWLAETNQHDPKAVEWLAEEWAESLALLESGIPLTGFCWYSLTDQVDWDVCLRERNGKVNPLGLVDLDRRVRAVGEAYAGLAAAIADGRFEALEVTGGEVDASAA